MPRTQTSGGENPEFVLRDFGGVNNRDAREGIGDEEFYWLENLMPLGNGNLVPVNDARFLQTIAETGPPTYTYQVSVAAADYVFAVWANSGNGWVINLASPFTATKIGSGLWTSGQTVASSYDDEGLLIVDPTGYWDYNITAPLTLTAQNNSAVNFTLQSATSIAGFSQLKQVLSVSGTGGIFQTLYTVTGLVLVSGGAGYAVGDTLSFTDNNPITPAQIVVATIGGSGAITAFTLSTGGSYPGPTSATLVPVGPGGASSTTSGAGTGAQFSTSVLATSVQITARGTGYANTDTLKDETSGATVIDSFILTTSGVIAGTSISTYAGRVWIGYLRTIFFTDIDSYNYFGGAGGSFTINDAYLHRYITALFSANNYLYIFGDDSIDALSNVTVSPSTGVTSFSRINITASIGCSQPTSIFPYFRGIAFYWNNGFWILSGSTPEKISDKILGALNELTGAVPNVFSNYVYGCQVVINSELCAAFLFSFVDTFTAVGGTRSIFALYFKQKWFFYSIAASPSVTGAFWVPIFGSPAMAAWVGNALYQMLSPTAPVLYKPGIIQTKLWDAGATMREKQAINVGIAAVLGASPLAQITYTVDTELGAGAKLYTPARESSSAGYSTLVQQVVEGGQRMLGLTVNTNVTAPVVDQIVMLALRGKTERDVLQ